ncbi:hypothetical protein HK098_000867 [Nowakowskiella sp. JEL0407]|nr:hypothetical protein HK098_000867 [Nowakowskiella sp. JEL0407]
MLPRSQGVLQLIAGCIFLIIFWVVISGVFPSESTQVFTQDSPKTSKSSINENLAEIKAQLTALQADLPKMIKQSLSSSSSSDKSSGTVNVPLSQQLKSGKKRRFAYGFYTTNDDYACATLNIAKSIEDVGGRSRSDIEVLVLYTEDVSEKFVKKFQDANFRAIPTKTIKNQAVGPYHHLWKHSVTKLSVFNMTEYDRIIYLDADALAVKNPDWLFDLPPHFLYSPRAYWLWDKQPWFNAQMFILEPSQQAFQRQMDFFYRNEKNGKVFYDMDIANEVFKNEAAVLPGTYQLVNTDLMNPGHTKINTLFDKTVDQVAEEAIVVHFTEGPKKAYGKPWHVKSFAEVEVTEGSHPLFLELYRRWFEYRDQLCL